MALPVHCSPDHCLLVAVSFPHAASNSPSELNHGDAIIFLRLACAGGGSIAHEYFHAI